MNKKIFAMLTSIILFISMGSIANAEGELDIQWVEGPTTVKMGDDLASFDVGEKYLFLNKEDTVEFNDAIGNFETGLEIGSVYPKSQDENWFVIFEYDDSMGYIENAEEEEIDAEEILQSFKEGTEENNKELEEKGFAPMHVLGWKTSPYFDDKTHHLTWALELEIEGESLVNYNIRLLNRYGYVSATLVADTQELDRLIPEVNRLLEGFSFEEGQRYEDFDPAKDKISEYGLAALITGGIGVVAAKKGFFAVLILLAKKFGILIIAGIGGIWAFIKKKFGAKPAE